MKLSRYEGTLRGVEFLDLLMLDIYGHIRHVTVPLSFVSDEVLERGIGFDASNFGFADVVKSDMSAIPDMETAFVEEKDGHVILHVLCDVRDMDGGEFNLYPRYVARNAIEHLRRTEVADDLQVLAELEFHILGNVKYAAEESQAYYSVSSQEGLGEGYDDLPRFNVHKGYHRIYPQDRYFNLRNQIVTSLRNAGIPVKYHHHEVGAAQHEIELDFMPLTEAADKVTLAKWIIRNIVREHDLFATFMPKPMYGLAGNGLHVHQYLVREGRSIFSGSGIYGLSETALAYVSGLLDHSLTGSMLAFTNPSTNSYKRLVPGYEAPVRANFARASREASVRVPGYLQPGEERIEYRTGDASANVHYMLASMIMAGLDGIARQADPVVRHYDDPEADQVFPLDLHRVLDGLGKDRAYLDPVFPASFVDLWIALKRDEANYVYRAPTPQEYELYF